MPSFRDILGSIGSLRYGVPTAEKERLARMGELPGAPEDTSADQQAADRYASGYLFGQAHPTIAPAVQPYVDMLKTSDLPFFGGSTPEEQSYASEGIRRAILEGENAKRQPSRAATLASLLK